MTVGMNMLRKHVYNLLIVQLLSEEYSTMSPGTLEAQGLINQAEYQKVAALTQSASPDAHKKIAGKRPSLAVGV
jgi:hypothetical protein